MSEEPKAADLPASAETAAKKKSGGATSTPNARKAQEESAAPTPNAEDDLVPRVFRSSWGLDRETLDLWEWGSEAAAEVSRSAQKRRSRSSMLLSATKGSPAEAR